ncbi:MAG: PepSY-associated TM helix domain-containing protein [Bacteroidales bacterium]
MQFKWRKWNRAVHRDLGYIFFALTIVYGLSGIAINHLHDWNPNYIISVDEFQADISSDKSQISKQDVIRVLSELDEEDNYKNHYFPGNEQLKVFIDGGNVIIDLETGTGIVEKIKRRPVFKLFNDLHYNPGKWWTWFSDAYAIALLLIAVSGLFILKGSKGITARGGWLTLLGIVLPIILFYQSGGSFFFRLNIFMQIISFFILYFVSLIISETLGKKSRLGIEWSFFLSMILTPVIAIIPIYLLKKNNS